MKALGCLSPRACHVARAETAQFTSEAGTLDSSMELVSTSWTPHPAG